MAGCDNQSDNTNNFDQINSDGTIGIDESGNANNIGDGSGNETPQGQTNPYPEINAEQGLAQPLGPLPSDSKEAIDSEVETINQELDNLDKDIQSSTTELGI